MANHNFTCPHCGTQLVASEVDSQGPGLGWAQPHTFQSTAVTPWQPASTPVIPNGDWHKLTPISKLAPTDVYANALDACVSFALTTLATAVLAYYLLWPWPVAPAAGFAIAVVRYFLGMTETRKLLCVVETFSPQQPAPPTTPVGHVVRVEVKEGGQRWAFADLLGQPAALAALANTVLDGGSFSEREAVKCGLSQEEFGQLRDEFIRRGWAEWNHPTRKQQGASVTPAGRRVLRAIATSPLPQQDETA